jgi:hypothetical protein
MIILSISVQSVEDISTLTSGLEKCRSANLGAIVHVAGLSRLVGSFGSDADREADRGRVALDALRDAITETGSSVWAGGWSGITQRHLSQDELEWDLTWSITNPWDTGLTRLLGVVPECVFPLEISGSQAYALSRSRIAKKHLLCLGYRTPVPGAAIDSAVGAAGGDGEAAVTEGNATGHLVLCAQGAWSVLPTVLLGQSGDGNDSVGSDAAIIHAMPSRSSPDTPPFPSRHEDNRAWRDTLAETGEATTGAPDSPGYFTSGLPAPRWADPAIMAARARLRASRRPSRERTRTILALDPAPAVTGKGSSDPFQNRELQGSVTGSLRLDTETVGAVVLEGRLAGLTMNGSPLTPPVRSQGFFQTPETVTYLETVNAAWFTGVHVRGVHETASFGDIATVETTIFAHDDIPGITLTHRVTVRADFPADALRIALMETPIVEIPGDSATPDPGRGGRVLSTGIAGATAGSDGSITECSVDGTAEGSSPWQWARDAVALRLDLPAASVWIAAAHPGATVTAPFSLGIRPTRSGLRLVWHPLGFAPGRNEPFLRRGSWTVSYRITSSDAPLLRVEDPIAGEIDGFTSST